MLWPSHNILILSYRDGKQLRWLWIPNITLVALSKCVEGVEEGIELFVSSAASWL